MLPPFSFLLMRVLLRVWNKKRLKSYERVSLQNQRPLEKKRKGANLIPCCENHVSLRESLRFTFDDKGSFEISYPVAPFPSRWSLKKTLKRKGKHTKTNSLSFFPSKPSWFFKRQQLDEGHKKHRKEFLSFLLYAQQGIKAAHSVGWSLQTELLPLVVKNVIKR